MMAIILSSLGMFFVVEKIVAQTDSEIKPGITILKNMEQRNVRDVEREIDKIEEEKEQKEEGKDHLSIRERMRNTVIMGDSRAEGFLDYEILDPAQVIAGIGIHLDELTVEVEEVQSRNPEVIFLEYGLNDIEKTGGDTERFERNYKKFLADIREVLPQSKIYINLILPVQQSAVEKKPIFSEIEQYNITLKKMSQEENIICIDSSSLLTNEMYAPDGIHFQPAFYPIWTEQMAEAAGL